MISLRQVSDGQEFDLLAEEWQRLAECQPAAGLFQTWEWQRSWWRHFGRGRRRLAVLVGADGGRVVGIAPLMISPGPLRKVEFIGSGAADYLDLLAVPGREIEFARAVAARLASHNHWHLVDLQHLPENSPSLEGLRSSGLPTRLRVQDVCPYLPLPGEWDELRRHLGKKMRSNLSYYRRLLEERMGARCRELGEGELAEGMGRLFELHRRRWLRRRLPGVFVGNRVRAFHREVSAQLHRRGKLRLYSLSLNGDCLAMLYCFSHQGRAYYYQGGFDPRWSRYSPGTVLVAHAIRRAVEEGCQEFDFLRGGEAYKYRWQAQDRRNLRLRIFRPTIFSRLARRMSELREGAEEYVKRKANGPAAGKPGGERG